jgi:hypothetical protein
LVRPERLSASRAGQDAVLIFGQEAQSRKPNELASLKRAAGVCTRCKSSPQAVRSGGDARPEDPLR